MQIKLSYRDSGEPIFRQTPHGTGVWKGHTFVGNDPARRTCDYLVVLQDAAEDEEIVHVESGRAILITTEPPMRRGYPQSFIDQFDLIVTCHRDFEHPNVRNEYQGLPWHIGVRREDMRGVVLGRPTLDYDALVRMPPPPKSRLLSTVTSSKSTLSGHAIRQDFLQLLKRRLGDDLDLFGRGVRAIPDKADAIVPYRYHLALENSAIPDYWTEKLSDSYLGWAFPIYWGCPNIERYFPADAMVRIDLAHPEEAADVVESTIRSEPSVKQLAALSVARELVLDRYNTFDVVARACEGLAATAPRTIAIRRRRLCEGSRLTRGVKRLGRSVSSRLRRAVGG